MLYYVLLIVSAFYICIYYLKQSALDNFSYENHCSKSIVNISRMFCSFKSHLFVVHFGKIKYSHLIEKFSYVVLKFCIYKKAYMVIIMRYFTFLVCVCVCH